MIADLMSLLELQSKDHLPVLENADGTLSFRQLYASCKEIAAELKEANVKTLALFADNSIEWLQVDFACQMAGVRLVPLPTFFSATQLLHAFNEADVDTLVTDSLKLAELLLMGKTFHTGKLTHTKLHWIKSINLSANTQFPQATGKITFTSGSTGNPKGVCLSNLQLIQQARTLANRVAISQEGRNLVGNKKLRHLCVLPLSTLLENVAGVYAPLLSGGQVIVPPLEELGYQVGLGLDASTLVKVIDFYQPDSFILTPQLLQLLLIQIESGWQAPACLKFIAVGGGKVSAALLRQARQFNLPVFEGYGLSECASVVSLNVPGCNKPGSVGKPLEGLGIGFDKGEIIITGNAMLGYLNEPGSWYPDQIATGDLGYQDKEGFLHINGRKSNLIISSFGRNINPEWVESEVLSEPGIGECVVYGDAQPYCVGLISPLRFYAKSNQLDLKQLVHQAVDKANARLPDYAQIKRWHLLSTSMQSNGLYTVNGRPRRQVIAEHFADLLDNLFPESFCQTSKRSTQEAVDNEIF